MRVDKSKWRIKTLSDVGTIISGSTPRTDNSLNWNNGVHNWVTPAELKGGKYYGSTAKKITDYAINHTNLTLMPTGTVLLSSRAPIGKVAITTEPMYCNQGFKNIVCNENISNDFLYYFLLYNNAELNRRGNGVTFKEISKKNVEAFPIVVPPIAEQEGIAAELDAIQTMIDGYKAQITDLDVLAQSIFLEMFGDPMSNPKGWRTNLFADIADSQLGKMINQKTQQGELKPFLCAVNVLDNNFQIDTIKQFAIKDEERDKYRVIKGDLLICEGGDAGRCAIWNKDIEMYYQKTLHRVRSSKLSVFYLMFILQFYKKQGLLTKRSNGLTIQHLTQKNLAQIRIPVSPLALQQQFATQVEAIERQKELIRLQLKDAETLMAERMQYYFS